MSNSKTAAEIRQERRAVSELNPAVYNPRKDLQPGDEEFERLRSSIETFGYVDPIIINEDGTVIGGHQRLKVLKLLGYDEVDCAVVNLNKQDEKALNIALNKIAGDWDEEKLAEIFQDLKAEDYDLSSTGFDEDEINNIILKFDESVDLEEADKDVPEPADVYFSRQGDLWLLGKHRLLCGDSTKMESFDALLGDEPAQLLITDPPYNVNYEGVAGKIMNDQMSDDKFKLFLYDMFTACLAHMLDGASAYIFHSDNFGGAFRSAFQDAGFYLKQCLVWVKNTFVLGRRDYQWRHEPVLYGWRPGAAHYFTDRRDLSTVIDESGRPDVDGMSREELQELLSLIYDEVDLVDTTVLYCEKPMKNVEHPTMKPTKLIAKLIENSSKPGWVVLDPFGGSGSTLIAAEATGRISRLIELDPKFCDVIVKRYAQVTGKRDITLVREEKKIPVDATGILDDMED